MYIPEKQQLKCVKINNPFMTVNEANKKFNL